MNSLIYRPSLERYSMSTYVGTGLTNFQTNSPVFWPTLYSL